MDHGGDRAAREPEGYAQLSPLLRHRGDQLTRISG